jgi:RNA polymerase sigma-70 factor, ECF subfamily
VGIDLGLHTAPQSFKMMDTADDSRGWIEILRGGSTPARDAVLGQLHGRLLQATRFELSRRHGQLSHVGVAERDNLAVQAADDALMAILTKLDDFRGASGPTAHEVVEERELLVALRDTLGSTLTPRQREVFTAVALNGVPIDVLAERRSTTRGALYKTVHDARRILRAALAEAGHPIGPSAAGGRNGRSSQARI